MALITVEEKELAQVLKEELRAWLATTDLAALAELEGDAVSRHVLAGLRRLQGSGDGEAGADRSSVAPRAHEPDQSAQAHDADPSRDTLEPC